MLGRETHKHPELHRLVGMPERRVLMWKYEDGPEDARDEGDPNDVGPAWIDTYDGDARISSEQVADGEWITRAKATGPSARAVGWASVRECP